LRAFFAKCSGTTAVHWLDRSHDHAATHCRRPSADHESQTVGASAGGVRAVLDAKETFGGHSDPHDDVTMLAARLV